ncbi:synaptotagmin-4 [Nilaparvata lugens]|uniref:synaptotagmin-4 n=1 Tax=Nilaparvata lugens TaxID=108931 RepID=UPI00193DFEF3|nr:synaptotagmin-4 [Nilaparvata lugens]
MFLVEALAETRFSFKHCKRHSRPISVPAVLGICLASTLFLVTIGLTYVCYRRREAAAAKGGLIGGGVSGGGAPVVFYHSSQKQKRSPVAGTPGGGGHYLRKSPSPNTTPQGGSTAVSPTESTTAGKSWKSAGNTPTAEEHPGLPGPTADSSAQTKLHIENEVKEKIYGDVIWTLGQLVFKIRYKEEKSKLVVSVVKCMQLPAKDPSVGSSYPYVKLQLLPEKRHKVKTRVLRKTCSPVYDEDFTFYGINPAQLQNTTLHFVVLSFDCYSRDDIIGEVFCSLATIDVADNQELTLCRDIQARSLKIQSQGRGELLVSLCWQPAANRLTVVVLKARNLPKMDVTGLADPYVKMYLLCNGQRIAKKKTHVKKRTLNPVFNESFVFEIPSGADGLDQVHLEFMLLDWDRVTKNEVIGRLELGGAKSSGAALHHWQEVCNSPRRQIAEWHKLRE